MAAANGNINKKPRLDLKLHEKHSICLVLDYGSQYTQLIGRRVRENGVYSMLFPGDSSLVSFHSTSLTPAAPLYCPGIRSTMSLRLRIRKMISCLLAKASVVANVVYAPGSH